MLYSRKYRPQTFREVEGQELPKLILRSIVANPSSSPQVLVLKGDYGTGKTSCARILARALNCLRKTGIEPCMECPNCLQDLSRSPYYREYDCSVSGSAEDARSLRETFFLHVPEGVWRVIVFDEAHLFSVQAQAVFLKVLEESLPPRVFVLFCTTDPKDLLPPIIDRAVEIFFAPVPLEGTVNILRSVSQRSGTPLSESEALCIARASRGHARAAVVALQTLSGVEDRAAYLRSLGSSEETSLFLLSTIAVKDREAFKEAVQNAVSLPLESFREGFYETVHGLMQAFVGVAPESPYADAYGRLANHLGAKVMSLIPFTLQPWFTNAMQKGTSSQAALWALWATFGDRNARMARSGLDKETP